MGRYRRNYSYADTPGNRVAHVAGIAGLWGMVGWIFTALPFSSSAGYGLLNDLVRKHN